MSAAGQTEANRIALLEAIRSQGKEWQVLAPKWGCNDPDPPWKFPLTGTFEALSVSGALPSLERRHAEDELGDSLYKDVPAPECYLLALAHTMIDRGLVAEGELQQKMQAVRSRLEEV